MAIISIRVIADTEIVNGIEWYYEIENEKAEIIPEPDEEPEEMTHTSTTEVPVPYVWLNAYPELMSRYEGDYETAANSVAANGINKVWECYVAGLNPTDITAKFISIITFNGNSPVITWDPNVEGRVYTIEGTSTLNPLGWDTPTNETHRFFRVKVSLPQEGDEGGTTDKIIMILFDARGGSVSPDNITYESNGVLGELPIPTFEGYAFIGWFDDINGGTEYTSTTPVPHEDMTLYAVWEAETYTVQFNANGGSGEMSNQTFTYGVEQALSSNTFTLEGYGFAGWATSADGDVVYADGEVVKNLTSEANGVVDLYAKWETTYTVCFNANGGEGTMSNQTFTYGVEQALSSNTFTLEGYGFVGWATSPDGDVVYADCATVKNLISVANGVVDLYAKWDTTYTVCFNANGGEGTMLNQTITHNVEQSLSSNEFKREGYAFAGWSTSPDGEVIYENTEKIKNLISEASSEIHLYAVWKSFFVYEGEHKGVQLWKDGPYWAETNIGAKNPEDFGYYFWWGDTIGYERENDKWVSTHKFESNFSFNESNTPTYGKDIESLFSSGWITSSGVLAPEHDAAQVKWGSNWRMPTSDDLTELVSNCTWTMTTKNGVEGFVINGVGAYSGASIFLPSAGWGDDTQYREYSGRYLASNPSSVDAGDTWVLADSTTINFSSRYLGCTIRPVVNQQYEVRFNANGGSGEMRSQTFTYGIEQALSPNKFYRNGYTFAGWTTIIEERRVFLADNRVVKNLTTKTDGIVTLDAVWITHSYTQLWKDGPYWAGTNIGAEKPWDYGDYFWWGDTDGSSFFLIFNSSNTPTYGKNDATLQSEGWITSSGILAPEHDTAQAFWGTKWRMPTHTELYNLYDRCPSVWVTINGVSGYLFSSSWNDFSESIFLPAGGYGDGASLIGVNMQGFYWSSAVSRSSGDSYYLYFDSELAPTMLDTRRHFGQSIRPVVNQQYTVRFNANGGLGTMEDQTFSYGVEQALSLNLYYNVSCTFEGWATSADGEVVYADGEVVENLTKEVDGVVELFAVWKLVDKVQLWEGGPYWATRNIGATNPEDYGLYFWWGDTVGHRPNGSSFSFSFDSTNTPTYNKDIATLQSEGWITSSGVLAPAHDAARAHWGSKWRMPTDNEFEALCDKCTWTWTTRNGINGYVVKGKGDYSSSSIFLPAAGYGCYGYGTTSLYSAGSNGCYWSSVPFSGTDYNSWNLDFYSSVRYVNYYNRFRGRPVRPVSDVH